MRSMDALHEVARTQDVRDGFVLIDRIAALEEVVRELLCRGESLSFYYASSHGKGCGCVPCGRLSNWEESVIKALELLKNGGK